MRSISVQALRRRSNAALLQTCRFQRSAERTNFVGQLGHFTNHEDLLPSLAGLEEEISAVGFWQTGHFAIAVSYSKNVHAA